jgi:hypothetical protein
MDSHPRVLDRLCVCASAILQSRVLCLVQRLVPVHRMVDNPCDRERLALAAERLAGNGMPDGSSERLDMGAGPSRGPSSWFR